MRVTKANGIAAMRIVFCNYRGGARRRNLDFHFSLEQFAEITKLPCHYCGCDPFQTVTTPGGKYLYNGIDRKDNSLGYIEGNVVPCCGVCNRAKMDMSYEDFMSWIRAVAEHLL